MGRAWVLYTGIILGLWLGAGFVWWRVDGCGSQSAVNGKCLIWMDGGIQISPIPPTQKDTP